MRDAMTERFENLFARLAQRREGAFVPFVNLCDPDPETSLAVLETLVASGADALELGIPFSDPCADGPVVEASADRALANGATPARCLDVLRRFRTAHPETPVCLMLYINLVATPGVRRFMQAAADAGADAVLIPDLPTSMREGEPEWDEAAREAGTNAVSKVADKTIELSDEAKGVVDRMKEHIHERIVKMPEETTRQAAEILGAAGEGAKDASELLNEHAVSLQEGLEFRSKDREK